ncbi:type I restriction-modification system subunit M N-terminal domain-containing protein [Neomicrococcus aestuarii]|uniref:N6 adenine-specific DNA methyltransferase N-terminal domain-containing protein n=1 Tax=Neomicrococcus aestuarii TaxID=556325 RepID=A0A1L2ZPR7_9MICC|nr:type I restriction-modification system subunit M N-terminal domain-containing protein [Neomicrococcus aestuarii]APF41186.1 hypothetical protein BHE16_09475 [Neomicrococcus aestuarii]
MRTTDLAKVRATLWAAADELRANSKLTPVQYRDPVLGLVFLAYGDNGESAYSLRVDYVYPSHGVNVEYNGPIDVNMVADDVVARIHADPEFAARVVAKLGADHEP